MALVSTISIGAQSSLTYRVHPVVVFSVLDHFKRRPKEATRVVGCLLGERVGNTVFIKNCFPEIVLTSGSASGSVDTEHHNAMLALHKRVNPKELIVGWYLTGEALTQQAVSVNDEFRKFMSAAGASAAGVGAEPVLVTVDTDLKGMKMGVRGYTAKNFSVGDRVVMSRFELVSLDFHATAQEKIGVDALITGRPDEPTDVKSPDSKSAAGASGTGNSGSGSGSGGSGSGSGSGGRLDAPSSLSNQLESLEVSMSNLWELIDLTYGYVSKVVAGSAEGKASIGRAISNALSAVPHFEPNSFAKLFNENIQDLLMIVYLANLTRTQIALADKMNSLFE